MMFIMFRLLLYNHTDIHRKVHIQRYSPTWEGYTQKLSKKSGNFTHTVMNPYPFERPVSLSIMS